MNDWSGAERRKTITISEDHFEKLLEDASEKGAQKALEMLGIAPDHKGKKDVQDMVDFITAFRDMKKTARKTVLVFFIIGFLGLFALGFWSKAGGDKIIHG